LAVEEQYLHVVFYAQTLQTLQRLQTYEVVEYVHK